VDQLRQNQLLNALPAAEALRWLPLLDRRMVDSGEFQLMMQRRLILDPRPNLPKWRYFIAM